MDNAFADQLSSLKGQLKTIALHEEKGSDVAFMLCAMQERLQTENSKVCDVLALDRHSLQLSQQKTWAPPRPKDAKGIAATRKRLRRQGGFSIAVVATLFGQEELLRKHSRAYTSSARALIYATEREAKNMKANANIAIRANSKHLTQLMVDCKRAITYFRTRVPVLLEKEKELKVALKAQIAPLEICQQRYQYRLDITSNKTLAGDVVADVLEQQVEAMGHTVKELEGKLSFTQEQVRLAVETSRQLEAQTAIMATQLHLDSHLLSIESQICRRESKR